MANNPRPEITAGTLISGAVDTTRASLELVLPVVGGLTVLATLTQYLAFNGSFMLMGIMQLALFVAAVITSYLVLESMLKKAGLLNYTGPRRFFPYLGLNILVILGVVAGIILLIVPGVYLAMRWSVAQARLIGRGEPVIDAIKGSWEMTKGYSLRIFLAVLAFVVIGLVIGFIAGILGPTNIIGIFISQLASYALSMIMLGLAVTLLGLIDPLGRKLSEVFE